MRTCGAGREVPSRWPWALPTRNGQGVVDGFIYGIDGSDFLGYDTSIWTEELGIMYLTQYSSKKTAETCSSPSILHLPCAHACHPLLLAAVHKGDSSRPALPSPCPSEPVSVDCRAYQQTKLKRRRQGLVHGACGHYHPAMPAHRAIHDRITAPRLWSNQEEEPHT